MMLHRNAATAAASRAAGQAANADLHRSVAVVIIALLLLLLAAVLAPLWINSERIDKGQGGRSDSAAGQHNRALASYYGFQCSARFIPATSG